jgi:integrase
MGTGHDVTLKECWHSWQRTWLYATGTRTVQVDRWNMLVKSLPADTELTSVTLPRLRVLQADLHSRLKPSTANDIVFKLLRPCLQHGVENGWIENNPAAQLKPLKKQATIREQPTFEQAEQIAAEVATKSKESAEIIRAMYLLGLGQAEIKGLLGQHVDARRYMLRIVRKKTGHSFEVPVFDQAKKFLWDLLQKGRLRPGKQVFDWRNPRRALVGACKRLGFPAYEPRALRRTFIIHALEEGVDPRVVAKWQGHRDAKLILSVYGNFIGRDHELSQADKLK